MSDAGAEAETDYHEREQHVLNLFTRHKRKLQFLAVSRCAHDDRLLAGVCRFSDSLWGWHAGSRLSPSASRTEIGSWHLDLHVDEELSPDAYEQADQLADEVLGEATRFENPASVVKVHSILHDSSFQVGPWRGYRHALQFFCNGLPLFAYTSCKCRRAYQVQMLALAHAGIRADVTSSLDSWNVEALPVKGFLKRGAPQRSAYRFTSEGVQVVLDER
ncbi:hypothetical protein GCM10020358_67710 [Amorphoplanes nipponensis]|uniref:Uncharacterized protein n=1 Tax=Actinoplanes nipponensis TaxID=135950 RepID=A0A919MNI1_9ACTN|nr:hypothetical protein [Actinoplanes nipponensis]GIE51606.1 hypothetical protein Ani05nite_51400 [Actinoplanes nipponensis]